MNEQLLAAMAEAMGRLGLEYGFMSYRNYPIRYPYFVGEYSEVNGTAADGRNEYTFMLTGFSRGSGALAELERARQKIRSFFTRRGRRFRFVDGAIAVIMYGGAFAENTDTEELKKIHINLTIKEWSVNE